MAHFSGLHLHPHDHRRNGERRCLRAVSLPEFAEQPGRPPGHARAGGDRAWMLQQHAVPRRGRPPCWVGCRPYRSTASRDRSESSQRVPRLRGLPRCQLRRQRCGGVVLEHRRLSRRRGLFTPPSETLGQRRELHPYEYLHLREPREPLGMRELPPQRRESHDISGAEPARPGGDRARMLQQHAVPRGGGRRAPGPV